MDWGELANMQDSGANIQSHGVTHRDLTNLYEIEAFSEIRRSKGITSADFFAYPYGIFDNEIIRETEEAGYLGAVSCGTGDNSLYQMKRIVVTPEIGLHDFLTKADETLKEKDNLHLNEQPKENTPEGFDEFYSRRDPWRYKHQPDDRKRIKEILDFIPEGYNDVCDIGCGEGLLTREYLKIGDNVWGLDISKVAIDRAIGDYGHECHFTKFDLREDECYMKFDLIIITGVFYYMDDIIDEVLDKVRGMLKPGGQLLTCHIKHDNNGFKNEIEKKFRLVRKKEFKYRKFTEVLMLFK